MTAMSPRLTAATHFFNLPELVTLVAKFSFYWCEWEINPELANLRLVNRACNIAATPYCFMDLHIHGSIAKHKWPQAWLNPRPDMARRAFLNIHYHPAHQDEEVHKKEEESLGAMISQMDRLQSFVYSGHRALTPRLLQTLKNTCTDLQVLHINFNFRDWPNSSIALDFDGLCGLRELMIYNLPLYTRFSRSPSDYTWWIPRLARLVSGSPGLKRLSLGFQTKNSDYRRGETLDRFDKLCHLYTEAGGSPLALESLELLGGLYPCDVDRLKQLVDLTHLRDVYIADGACFADSREGWRIAYDAFAPQHSPNLLNFRTDEYLRDVHEHLCSLAATDPSFVRRLAISCMHWTRGTGLDASVLLRATPEHPALPLQVRMLDLELCRERVYGRGKEVEVSAAEVLEDLVATNADTLEGLAVNIYARELHDSLEQIEGRVQLLEGVLGRLPKLEQLSIGMTDWFDVSYERAMAKRLAAVMGPRVRYVSVGLSFMRVWHETDAVTGGTRAMVKLINSSEVNNVELWKYGLINPQNGIQVNERRQPVSIWD